MEAFIDAFMDLVDEKMYEAKRQKKQDHESINDYGVILKVIELR